MDGILFPEISAMSQAQIGGYLSKGAATQLAAFRDSAKRPRYVFRNFTATDAEARPVGTTCTISYSGHTNKPANYTYVGSVGFNMSGGAGGSACNASNGFVYSQACTYSSSTITPTIQILFARD